MFQVTQFSGSDSSTNDTCSFYPEGFHHNYEHFRPEISHSLSSVSSSDDDHRVPEMSDGRVKRDITRIEDLKCADVAHFDDLTCYERLPSKKSETLPTGTKTACSTVCPSQSRKSCAPSRTGWTPPSKKCLRESTPEKDQPSPKGFATPLPPTSPTVLLRNADFFNEYAHEALAWKCSQEGDCWYGSEMALSGQVEVTAEMRSKVLNWLIAVNQQFGFSLETWCLTVSLLDRFLSLQPIDQDVLQLAGLTAFFIAAKCEEVEPPQISDLIGICASSYTRSNFRVMEMIMLYRLRFRILSPTIAFMLHHQVEVEGLGDAWPYELSVRLIEQTLCDKWLSNFPPSVASFAILKSISENWHPAIYPDDIHKDEDYVLHLMTAVITTMVQSVKD